jgi:hypothetical protein
VLALVVGLVLGFVVVEKIVAGHGHKASAGAPAPVPTAPPTVPALPASPSTRPHPCCRGWSSASRTCRRRLVCSCSTAETR